MNSRDFKKRCDSCEKIKQNRCFYRKGSFYDAVCMVCRRTEASIRYIKKKEIKDNFGLCNTEIMASKKEGPMPWFDYHTEKLEAFRNAQ